MKDTIVILNPAAKGHKAGALADRIAALSPRIDLRLASAPGSAAAIARDAAAEGRTRIIAAGGDGTINEVINGIHDANVLFGLLPAGTMNVFAAELGLPGGLEECWKIIEQGHTRLVDLGTANGSQFIQLAGIGLDAQAVGETLPEHRKNFGPLSYVMSAAIVAARKPPVLKVRAEGRDETTGSFVLVGNGRYYGGPFVLFNNAKIDDQKLDVVVFHSLSYFDIIRYLQEIVVGHHTAMPDVEYFQTSRLLVSSENPVPFEVDGENLGETPVEFALSSKQLRVFAPPSPNGS